MAITPRLALMFSIVLLDIISFSLFIPVLPYYALSLGASPTEAGILTGIYALCQFFGAPIIGRLSDFAGRKPLLLLDFAVNTCAFFLLAHASALWMLFLARCLAGCVAATLPLTQAYMSDITPPEQRSNALGLLGAAFGLGFTIGPFAGGMLSKHGYALPALVAAAVCAANFMITALLLPESQSRSAPYHDNASAVLPSFCDMTLWKRLITSPRSALLLLFWAAFSVAFAMFQQNIALVNKLQLQLSSRETGYVFAWIGILVFIMQGGVLRLLTKAYSDEALVRMTAPILVVSLLGWAFTSSWYILACILVPLCFSASTLITVVNSLLSKSVPIHDVGATMGIAGAIDNSTRFITAFAGGALIERVGTFAPGVCAALVMSIALILLPKKHTA